MHHETLDCNYHPKDKERGGRVGTITMMKKLSLITLGGPIGGIDKSNEAKGDMYVCFF